jgi:hypothetical protein
MRIHRALAALQILSALAVAGAVHAQDAAPAPAAPAAVASALAASVPDDSVGESPEADAPRAPVRARGSRVAALAVAFEPVTLAPGAKVDPELEADCKFEEIVATDVGKMLHHFHLGGGKPTGNDARLLRIAVTDVSGESGGIYTGTKSMRIHVTLVVNGKVERETDLYRYNTGGNPFRGTCHIFRQHTRKLGKDVSAWIKDANYHPDDQPVWDKDDAQ